MAEILLFSVSQNVTFRLFLPGKPSTSPAMLGSTCMLTWYLHTGGPESCIRGTLFTREEQLESYNLVYATSRISANNAEGKQLKLMTTSEAASNMILPVDDEKLVGGGITHLEEDTGIKSDSSHQVTDKSLL